MNAFSPVFGLAGFGAIVLLVLTVIAVGEGVRYAIARYRKRRESLIVREYAPTNPVAKGDRVAVVVRRVANGYLVMHTDYDSGDEYVWCCPTVEDVCAHTQRRLAEMELSR